MQCYKTLSSGCKVFPLKCQRRSEQLTQPVHISDALNAAHRILVCVRFKHGSVCVNANAVAACSFTESDFTSARGLEEWNQTKHRGQVQKWPSNARSFTPTHAHTDFTALLSHAEL